MVKGNQRLQPVAMEGRHFEKMQPPLTIIIFKPFDSVNSITGSSHGCRQVPQILPLHVHTILTNWLPDPIVTGLLLILC